MLACALGPFAFGAVLKIQSGTPTDAVFGVWVHSTGVATSLVILELRRLMGLPADRRRALPEIMFASEDRQQHLEDDPGAVLQRVSEVFTGKLLAVGHAHDPRCSR